jgi:hypothetical protein
MVQRRTRILLGAVALVYGTGIWTLLNRDPHSDYDIPTGRTDELLNHPSSFAYFNRNAVRQSVGLLVQLSLDPFKDNVTSARVDLVTSLNDATSNVSTTTNWRKSSLRNVVPYFSSVDYFACCGAGHRFTKLADAYYLAKRVQFSVRVFFGFCTDPVQELFSYFFGPQPYEEAKAMARNSTPNLVLRVGNEVPGFKRLIREGPNSTCPCTNDHLESDVELFHGLRDRFRAKNKVDSFRKEFFTNYTVIGMHVRTGNGETGDFERKNRTIGDITEWQNSIVNLLVSLSSSWTQTRPPLLFIATDTGTVSTSLRTLLAGKMPVIDLSQDRMDHGEGILFGAQGNIADEGRICLNGWESVYTDMMLLSHADVVVAARPSSFTQSIPMTMVLSTNKSQRQVLRSYCEVNPAATDYVCYEDLMDWCCNGVTSFSLRGIQRYDYKRVPRTPGLDEKEYQHHIKPRPRGRNKCMPLPAIGGAGVECLPYQFPAAVELESATIR